MFKVAHKLNWLVPLISVIALSSAATGLFADHELETPNTYNFTNTAPEDSSLSGLEGFNFQYNLPETAFPQVLSSAPATSLPELTFAKGVGLRPSANNKNFKAYRFIRADVALMFNKYEQIDAGAQQVEFDKASKSIGVRAGLMLKRHFGVEGRLGVGLSSQSQTNGATTSDFKTSGYVAALGRAQVPLGNNVVPYANLGLAAVKTSFESKSGAASKTVDEATIGLAAAVGVEVNLQNNLVLGLEASYLPTNIKALSATVGYNF
ncbi:MAG: outer membrane beta-barrel protein [Alphaproteobacteria bacterium]